MSKMYDPEKTKNMPKVILTVRGKGTVEENLVASFKALSVALMQPPPEVMNWGSRVFVFKEKLESGDLVYVEGLAYPLIVGHTCEEVE